MVKLLDNSRVLNPPETPTIEKLRFRLDAQIPQTLVIPIQVPEILSHHLN